MTCKMVKNVIATWEFTMAKIRATTLRAGPERKVFSGSRDNTIRAWGMDVRAVWWMSVCGVCGIPSHPDMQTVFVLP